MILMKDETESFGGRLRQLRIDRDMSQEEMGKLLGTSKQVISRYENGLRTPKITIANQYATQLGVSLSYLLGSDVAYDDELVRMFMSLPRDKQVLALEFAKFLRSEEKQ